MRLLSLALVATLLAAPAVARADAGGGQNYRAEIGTIDAATTGIAIGFAITASDDSSIAPLLVLTGIAALAGPTDHLARGNEGRAGISLAAHLALPALGGAIGSASADGKGLDGIINIIGGILIGHAAAIGADIYMAKVDGAPAGATPRMISFGGSF